MKLFLVAFFVISAALGFSPSHAVTDANHAYEIDADAQYGAEGHHESGEHVDAAHGAGHDAEHDSGGLPQLDPTYYPSQLFWLAVTFALLYFAMRVRVLPDLSGVIERRRERIDSDIQSAQKLKAEAESVHAAYEESLAEAREKSTALFERVESKIKEKEQQNFQEFRDKSAKEIAKAEAEIVAAKEKAMKDMNEVAAEIAAIAAEQIVGVTTDKKKAISVVEGLGKKKAA
jgi:F-type H+-transporting ATPase subunit b